MTLSDILPVVDGWVYTNMYVFMTLGKWFLCKAENFSADSYKIKFMLYVYLYDFMEIK